MNTITLNGIASNTITGLLIQELPAITRPKMRVQQTTVDGRPGDIITKLGYESYDREVSVGLHGSFDIDEVVAFFSGEGEAIFSNEPDKVYQYCFIDKADFTRLVRFRTAKIKMHCQPYKHSATEGAVAKTLSGASGSFTITNSGNTSAKPTLDIVGSGTVQISVPGQVLQINMANDPEVIIDCEQLEAYYGNALKNRLVTGNLNGFILAPGENTISWENATRITLTNYSRWI